MRARCRLHCGCQATHVCTGPMQCALRRCVVSDEAWLRPFAHGMPRAPFLPRLRHGGPRVFQREHESAKTPTRAVACAHMSVAVRAWQRQSAPRVLRHAHASAGPALPQQHAASCLQPAGRAVTVQGALQHLHSATLAHFRCRRLLCCSPHRAGVWTGSVLMQQLTASL